MREKKARERKLDIDVHRARTHEHALVEPFSQRSHVFSFDSARRNQLIAIACMGDSNFIGPNSVCSSSLQSQSPIPSSGIFISILSSCFVAILSAIRWMVYPSHGVLNYTSFPNIFTRSHAATHPHKCIYTPVQSCSASRSMVQIAKIL